MATSVNSDFLEFEGSRLMISARSPFARRVRLAFLEHGVGFEEIVLDVLKPQPELWAKNPLGRVPTLILRDGQVLWDSNFILQAFYEGRSSRLMPQDRFARMECLKWSTLAAGLCEKLVEYYLEALRPEPARDPEMIAEA